MNARKRFCAVALACALVPGAALVHAAGGSASGFELRCKIKPGPSERGYKLWKVELKRSSGEPVRQGLAGAGDTLTFRGFDPGPYIVCILGEKANQCKSIDLVAPAGQTAYRFSLTMSTPSPAASQRDSHQMHARRLAVPGAAHREMVRAEQAQLRGDSAQALSHLERAVQIYPGYVEALNNIGTHYHRGGNYARSAEYFGRATEIDPKFFAGWVNLGGSLLASGKIEPALEANLRAVKLRPDDPLVNAQLGMTYYYLRRYADAKIHFHKVVATDPSSANSPQLYLAHIAIAEHQPREAQEQIRSYLELHPNSPRAPDLRRTLENIASGRLARVEAASAPER